MPADQATRDRWRHYWDKHSASYDKQMRFLGLTIEHRERFKLGLTERLAARKPAPARQNLEEASAVGSEDQDRPAGS